MEADCRLRYFEAVLKTVSDEIPENLGLQNIDKQKVKVMTLLAQNNVRNQKKNCLFSSLIILSMQKKEECGKLKCK